MRARLILFAAFVLVAGHVFAQAPAAPAPPAPPAAVSVPAAPSPAAPALPAPPRREGQPVNVKIELNITEDGGGGPPIKKSVIAVVGDGFSGYVRQQGFAPNPNAPQFNRSVPLNLDASPLILAGGKIRPTCSIQYNAGSAATPAQGDPRTGTEIKQNLILNLESGKTLVISQGTDPIGDRRVTVEVTATILK